MHISEKSKVISKKNILLKLSIIEDWLNVGKIPNQMDGVGMVIRDLDGELMIEWFPKSVNEFSKWDGSQNSVGINYKIQEKWGLIKSLSRSTLDLYPEIKNEIQLIIKGLIKLELAQKYHYNKNNRINDLEKHLSLEITKKEITQTRYLTLLSTNAELRTLLEREQLTHQNNITLLTDKLIASEAKVAELTKTISKITALHIKP